MKKIKLMNKTNTSNTINKYKAPKNIEIIKE